MTQIKAIETHYAGCRFRSRLEARWAVFFDHLGIKWQYEPEGYETSAGWYLPDFRVDPGVPNRLTERNFDGLYAEVKGGGISIEDSAKCRTMADDTNYAILRLGDIPDPRDFKYLNAVTIDAWWFEGGTYPIALDLWRDGEYSFYPCAKGLCGSSNDSTVADVRESFAKTFSGDVGTDGCSVGPARLFMALTAARSARFEHGESPKRA